MQIETKFNCKLQTNIEFSLFIIIRYLLYLSDLDYQLRQYRKYSQFLIDLYIANANGTDVQTWVRTHIPATTTMVLASDGTAHQRCDCDRHKFWHLCRVFTTKCVSHHYVSGYMIINWPTNRCIGDETMSINVVKWNQKDNNNKIEHGQSQIHFSLQLVCAGKMVHKIIEITETISNGLLQIRWNAVTVHRVNYKILFERKEKWFLTAKCATTLISHKRFELRPHIFTKLLLAELFS